MMSKSFIFVLFFMDKPQIILPQEVSISVFIAFISFTMIWSIRETTEKKIMEYDELSIVDNVWMRSIYMNECSF